MAALQLIVIAAVAQACFAASCLPFPIAGPGTTTSQLTQCDDCHSDLATVTYTPIYLQGNAYGYYSVNSNGYITLYSSSSATPTSYGFFPQPLDQLTGPPIVAPYFADVHLSCGNDYNNRVTYYSSNDASMLAEAQNMVRLGAGASSFVASSMVIVSYSNVQRFPCSIFGGATNSFQLAIVSDAIGLTSYAIVGFGEQNWYRNNELGFGSGAGQREDRIYPYQGNVVFALVGSSTAQEQSNTQSGGKPAVNNAAAKMQYFAKISNRAKQQLVEDLQQTKPEYKVKQQDIMEEYPEKNQGTQ